jgi:hypothetical protein
MIVSVLRVCEQRVLIDISVAGPAEDTIDFEGSKSHSVIRFSQDASIAGSAIEAAMA